MVVEHNANTLHTPFCRSEELAEIIGRLQREDCSAIFLSSEMGLGTTTLLRELSLIAAGTGAVITLHGTPSLASIPFGILAPVLRRSSSSFVKSHVDVIRQTLAFFDEQEEVLRGKLGVDAALNQPLLIIDEADCVDKSTAELAVTLAQAGKIKLVIAHRASTEPVPPLSRLWDAGLAERFHLGPLTRSGAHEFCVQTLGGQPTETTSWYLWNTTGGNPLLMRLVMEDAIAHRKLRLKGNIWVMDIQAVPAGHQLKEVIKEQLRGLSKTARTTLDLVALAEPVRVQTIGSLLDEDATTDLITRRLLQETSDGSGVLRLVNPVYGEVLRELVPRSQSRILHNRLVGELEEEPATPESLLRLAIWTLESGHTVSDEKLLSAAIFACKLYESALALRLTDEVADPANVRKAQIIKARAAYNMGEYSHAAELLEQNHDTSNSISELLLGTLLRAATHSALGHSAATIHDDAANLRLQGERLAKLHPETAADVSWRALERADVLDMMAHSISGNYLAMAVPRERVLGNRSAPADSDHLCNRSLVLALDSERLSALGRTQSARETAAAAFAIQQTEDHTVYFVPEMIATRIQIAALIAGEWDEAEQLLKFLAVDVGKATISFGGSVGVARGMLMLRQGKIAPALDVLVQGFDALQHSDPQHLYGYCVSMAAYAAARLGRDDTARDLMARYREDSGPFVIVGHERGYIAAAREHLFGDGTGLVQLLALADDAAKDNLLGLELNALELAAEFDPGSVKSRLLSVALQVEGSWAAGLAAYAAGLGEQNSALVVEAAEKLLDARMYHHAQKLLRLASTLVTREHDGNLVRRVREGLEKVDHAGLARPQDPEAASNRQRRIRELLTARELEIASMAADGMTDKAIAGTLHVSVRTVEGHLYRAYAKLGITARNDLPPLLAS